MIFFNKKKLHNRIFGPKILHTRSILWLFLLTMKHRQQINIGNLSMKFFNCFSIKSHLSVTNFLNWETTTFHYLTERNIPLWTWDVEPSWRLMVLGGPAWTRHPKGHLSSSEFRFLRKSHQLVTLLTLGKFNAQSTFSWFCNLTFIKHIKEIIWQAAYNWGESMMEVD